MSCFFCRYYNGLFKECGKNVIVNNLSESFDCRYYDKNSDYDETNIPNP